MSGTGLLGTVLLGTNGSESLRVVKDSTVGSVLLVTGTHRSDYATRVTGNSVDWYGAHTAAEHTSLVSSQVLAECSALYGSYVGVTSDLSSRYRIEAKYRVPVALDCKYETSVQASQSSEYGNAFTVNSYVSSHYGDADRVSAYATHYSEDTERVSAAHTSWIYPAAFVSGSHAASSLSAARVVVGSACAYESAAFVHAYNTAPSLATARAVAGEAVEYADCQYVQSYLTMLTSPSSRVTAYNEASSVDAVRVLVGSSCGYRDFVGVNADHALRYGIYDTEKAYGRLSAYYSIAGSALVSGVDAVPVVRSSSGAIIDCDTVSVSCHEGEYVWKCELSLLDAESYSLLQRGSYFSVDIGGESFTFVVDSRSLSRREVTDISMTVSGCSPAILLSGPYSSKSSYTETTARSAKELVEYTLGTTVDWQVHDWVIPAYRFSYTNLYPIEAAKLIVSAIGALLESNPDGSLYVRYEFPVTVTGLPTAAHDLILTDIDHNLSVVESIAVEDTYDQFRVRDSAPAVSDSLEFEAEEGYSDRGTLKAYPYPWRNTVHVEHTDGLTVNLTYMGVSRRTEKQLVEIKDGAGKLSYPCVGILSVRWMSSVLSGLHVEPRSTDVYVTDLTTNYGYGLVEITYAVDSMDYRVQFPAGASTQFLLVDG